MIVTESEWAAAERNEIHVRVVNGPDAPKPPCYDDVVDSIMVPQMPSFSLSPPIPISRQSSPGIPSRSGTPHNSRARLASTSIENLRLDSSPSSPAIHLVPFVCIWEQASFNSMVLRSRDDGTPFYHVSVDMNCFIPTSHITTIRRGGSPYGEVVGSFEMGIAMKKSAVTMAGRERLMDVVLNKAGNKANRVWQWKWHNNRELHLSWHCDSPVKYCYLAAQAGTPNASLLASFTPQPLAPRADGHPSPPSSLKVFPDGQWLFDDIVISTLILERKRLTPDPRRLFN